MIKVKININFENRILDYMDSLECCYDNAIPLIEDDIIQILYDFDKEHDVNNPLTFMEVEKDMEDFVTYHLTLTLKENGGLMFTKDLLLEYQRYGYVTRIVAIES